MRCRLQKPAIWAQRHARRAWIVLLAVVTLQLCVTGVGVARSVSELTSLHYLVGILLSVILPLLAVFLLWRGHMAGRWILIGLFALRGAAEASWLVYLATIYPSAILSGSGPLNITNALFYSAATLWLLFSRHLRPIRCDGSADLDNREGEKR